MSDFKQMVFAPGYPKRVEIRCFCHVSNDYWLSGSTPAPELCVKCQGWVRFFENQYREMCEKAGVIYLPT